MHDFDEFPEHIHLDFESGAWDVSDALGVEKLLITSVGIDVGSSTSHLMFSHLTVQRDGSALSAQFRVTDRQVFYQSPIILTPYATSALIDVERLEAFVQEQYQQAGLTAEAVDTGVVVITGEALNKENAQPIAELFARQAGRFICASAGPHHEALLAAHGSGAVAGSRTMYNTALNVDVGGGTSKLSLIRQGEVVGTAAISVGARLLAFDADGRVERVEAPARRVLHELGRTIEVGDVLDAETRRAVVRLLAGALFEVMEGAPRSPLAQDLMVTAPLPGYAGLDSVDYVVFSGGVSEYVYGHEAASFGDLGSDLGAAIRHRIGHSGARVAVRAPTHGIRATVIGAGEYTVQVSGMTSYISDTAALPAFGLKVVRATIRDGESLEASLAASLARFDLARFEPGVAIALAVPDAPTYPLLRRAAHDLAELVAGSETPGAPLFLIVDADVAKSLGGILKEEAGLPGPLVAIDGIDVGDLDYVDVGRSMGVTESLPVTVKSLVFPKHGQ